MLWLVGLDYRQTNRLKSNWEVMMNPAIDQETLSEPDVVADNWETVTTELSVHAKGASFVAVALPGSDEAFSAEVSKAVFEVMKEIGKVIRRQRDLDVAAISP
jgi:hypothetical protein